MTTQIDYSTPGKTKCFYAIIASYATLAYFGNR